MRGDGVRKWEAEDCKSEGAVAGEEKEWERRESAGITERCGISYKVGGGWLSD